MSSKGGIAMRRSAWYLLVLWAASLVCVPVAHAQEDVYYARCNLKVIDGNEITWINWQAAPTFVPVGTKLQVTKKKDTASLVDPGTKAAYTLDIGAEGDAYLEKFVTKRPVDIAQFPADVQANIRQAVAKVGMTKEQVYIAMGPPTNVGKERTNKMTYDQIVASNLWVYARRRLAKNIGVAFDPATGLVNRTEGIWGKD
jgi:hypothetical protein